MVWGLLFQPICDIVDDWKSSTLVYVWKKLGALGPRTFWTSMHVCTTASNYLTISRGTFLDTNSSIDDITDFPKANLIYVGKFVL